MTADSESSCARGGGGHWAGAWRVRSKMSADPIPKMYPASVYHGTCVLSLPLAMFAPADKKHIELHIGHCAAPEHHSLGRYEAIHSVHLLDLRDLLRAIARPLLLPLRSLEPSGCAPSAISRSVCPRGLCVSPLTRPRASPIDCGRAPRLPRRPSGCRHPNPRSFPSSSSVGPHPR